MAKKKIFGFLMVLVLLVSIIQVSTVTIALAGVGDGVNDNFSGTNGTVPTDWVVSGAGAGDSATIQNGTLQMVKTTASGTMTVSRNNLNLNLNAGGKIIFEFEAQFPALGTGYSANGKFGLVKGIKEDGVTNGTIISAYFDGTAKMYVDTYEYGAAKISPQLLWDLQTTSNNPPTMWHKLTYVIDTDTDTFTMARTDESVNSGGVTGIPGTTLRATDVMFSDNAKYKTISSIDFTMPAGTANTTTYNLRNFKIYPYVPTTTPNATYGGINETFAYPVDSAPTIADGWGINGLRAGDFVSVKDDPSVSGGKMLSIFKSKSDTGTYINLSRNNLNLDLNAKGQIKVELEAQFPNLSKSYANNFPNFHCINEAQKIDYNTIKNTLLGSKVYSYYWDKPYFAPTPGSQPTDSMFSSLNTTAWNKLTFIIDTDSDDYSSISGDSNIRLSNVGFSTGTAVANTKIKSLNQLAFALRNADSTTDVTYNIRNLKVTPIMAPTVISSTPASGTSLTGVNNSATLNFNTDIDTTTLTTANITVMKGAGQTAFTAMPTSEYSITPILDGVTQKCTSATVNFTNNLSNITEYKIVVGTGVKSLLQVNTLNTKTVLIVPTVQLTAFSVTGAATTAVTASVSLKNYSASPQPTTFIVAAYDKVTGALVGAGTTTATIQSKVAALAVPLTINLPTAGTNYTIKGYLWDSSDTMIPLKPSIPLQ